jgi:hypothetical protein
MSDMTNKAPATKSWSWETEIREKVETHIIF